MLFSSLVFLYVFLPIVLIGNLLLPTRFKNGFLLLSSLIFFAWGGVSLSSLLIVSILMNYGMGRWLGFQLDSPTRSRNILALGVFLNLLMLGILKYTGFIIGNVNLLLESPIKDPGIILPIGISFYTFQAISYLIDVYRKEVPVQKNLIRLALFIALFPQLIAGPIVRYKSLAAQLSDRKLLRSHWVKGIERFMLGLGKKVLIANQFAVVADVMFKTAPDELSTVAAWIGIFSYSMQIYFDFSGYSDMAIGLGSLLGFKFPENFNFPYISLSIREFWRRWHITLSEWFRDYLYIPLGGNRKGELRTLLNLLIVFFLTGIWHGASWNFVVWGLIHGLFLVWERGKWGRLLDKLWFPIRNLYTIWVVAMAWILFRAENFTYAWEYFQALYSYQPLTHNLSLLPHFLNPEFYWVSAIGILGAWGVIPPILRFIHKGIDHLSPWLQPWIYNGIDLIEIIGYTLILVFSTLYLTAESYNPFIYFQF